MNSGKLKIPLLEAAKYLLILVLAGFIFLQLSTNRESTADFSGVQEAVLAAADTETMVESDNMMFKRLYGLDAGDYDAVMLFTPTTNMGAEELLLVKLRDLSQQETVVTAMETRIETQIGVFEGYGVEQTAMLEKAVLEVQGNYILLVVAADPSPVKQAFLGAL